MPDRFTEVTRTGYGKRIGNSFSGIIIGLILFFVSFVVLYTNEGSVDFSVIAKTAVEIDSSQELADPALKDKLLVTSGVLTSTETLGDDMYLNPGKYIAIERKAEMYAWVEKKSSKSKTETGGSETTTTTYDYVREWTDSPESAGSFKYPEGHQNPAMELKGVSKRVNKATIGIYDVDMANVTMPSLTSLPLTAENSTLKDNAKLEGGEFIYLSKTAGSTYQTPSVGDVRVSYDVFSTDQNVTIFGKLTGKTFGTYLDPDNNRFFRIFTGTKEEAIASLHESYVMMKWIWRGIGFLMMWFGLSAILGPLSVIMDFLPFLGGLSRNLIGAVTFVVALVLSGVTILIGMLFHSVVALVVVVLALFAIGFMILQQKKGQSSGVKLPPVEPPGHTPPPGAAPPAGPSSPAPGPTP